MLPCCENAPVFDRGCRCFEPTRIEVQSLTQVAPILPAFSCTLRPIARGNSKRCKLAVSCAVSRWFSGRWCHDLDPPSHASKSGLKIYSEKRRNRLRVVTGPKRAKLRPSAPFTGGAWIAMIDGGGGSASRSCLVGSSPPFRTNQASAMKTSRTRSQRHLPMVASQVFFSFASSLSADVDYHSNPMVRMFP